MAVTTLSNMLGTFHSNCLILAAAEKQIRRGVKEVIKAVNKDTKGYVHERKRVLDSSGTEFCLFSACIA